MEQLSLFDVINAENEKFLLSNLLEQSKIYHLSTDYRDLLDFVTRLPNFAPFNALLIKLQKPGLLYASSEHDWRRKFNRTIKEGALRHAGFQQSKQNE